MDIPLDLLDVPLGVLLGLELEEVEAVLLLLLHLLLHPSLLDLDAVLFLLNGLLKTGAVLLPGHEF